MNGKFMQSAINLMNALFTLEINNYKLCEFGDDLNIVVGKMQPHSKFQAWCRLYF